MFGPRRESTGKTPRGPGAEQRRADLGITAGDIVAGVSVALVVIPQSVAYARLAGMPPHVGLYSAALPALAAAIFASSQYLQTGPTAMGALLTYAALTPLATVGSPEYVALGTLLCLMVGALTLLVGLLRGGVVAYLMSEPVVAGFTTGAAVLIIASQIPAVLGAQVPPDGVLPRAMRAFSHVSGWDRDALFLSGMTMAILVAARRIHPLIPGVLLAAAFSVAYAAVRDYAGPTVGAVSAALVPTVPEIPWSALPSLLLPAAVFALVAFGETSAIARSLAARDRARWDPDRELVSQGVANLAAGLAGGFPVAGSFSRSSLNRLAGARSRWSGAVTGLAVLLFLPFAPVVASLPVATLGSIVIAAVTGLVRFSVFVELWRISRPQFMVAVLTLTLTLVLAPHIEQAVIVGMLAAVAVHLWRELRPAVEAWVEQDTLHVRPHGVLWFGSAPGLEQTFVDLLAQHRGVRRLVIHAGGLGRIDVTGALMLRGVVVDAKDAGLEVVLEDVHPLTARTVRTLLAVPERE